MPNEAQIREKLVPNLALLEPGLVLVGTEVPLVNPLGAKGFVDILARDALGNRVVIEIKRSDAASRSALHEIYKYLALLQVEQSIPSHKLRCFLISTDWHELYVPFSEFVRTAPYQVEGRHISVDEAGNIIKIEMITVQEASKALVPFRHHDILLFTSAASRNVAIPNIATALDKAGSHLAVLLSLDYGGPNPLVQYPFAVYVAVIKTEMAVMKSLEKELLDSDDLSKGTSKADKEHLLAQAFSRLYLEKFSDHETYEIGYPEKYLTIRREGWKLSNLYRQGSNAENFGLTDAEIDVLVSGEEGQNLVVYRRISSPRLRASWKDLKSMAAPSLAGNQTWQKDFHRFLKLSAAEYPTSTVAVSVFNPLNVTLWMIKMLRRRDRRYLPEMECIISTGEKDVAYLYGFVENWRSPSVKNVDELLMDIAGEPFELFLLHHFGEAWTYDSDLMTRLGLRYTSILFHVKPGGSRSAETYTPGRSPWEAAWQNNFYHDSVIDRYLSDNADLLDEFLDVVGTLAPDL